MNHREVTEYKCIASLTRVVNMERKEADFELSDGVTYEVLPESDFTMQTNSIKHGLVKLLPYNQVFPRAFLKRQKKLKEFQCRQDDVWVASFPGCGMNMIQFN